MTISAVESESENKISHLFASATEKFLILNETSAQILSEGSVHNQFLWKKVSLYLKRQ